MSVKRQSIDEPKKVASNGRKAYPKNAEEKLRNISLKLKVPCPFCRVPAVDADTLTCKKCNTTIPRNLGPNQLKRRNGRDL